MRYKEEKAPLATIEYGVFEKKLLFIEEGDEVNHTFLLSTR